MSEKTANTRSANNAVIFIANEWEFETRFKKTVSKLRDKGREVHVVSVVRNTMHTCDGLSFPFLIEGPGDTEALQLPSEADKALFSQCENLGIRPECIHIHHDRGPQNALVRDTALKVIGRYASRLEAKIIVAPSPFPKDCKNSNPTTDDMALGLAALMFADDYDIRLVAGNGGKAVATIAESAALSGDLLDNAYLLKGHIDQKNAHIAQLETANNELAIRLCSIEGSTSLKAGRAITAIPRKLKSAIRKNR